MHPTESNLTLRAQPWNHIRCVRCGELKPPSAFGNDRQSRSGRKPACRECHSIASRGYRARTHHTPRNDGSKRCSACGQSMPRGNFPPNRQSTDGRHGRCRECLRSDGLVRRTGANLAWKRWRWHAQGKRCACGDPLAWKDIHIDHAEVDGRKVPQAVLHRWCNMGLGQFYHSESRLRSMSGFVRYRPLAG